MKRLLMIAYHFPPLAGSSGVQRALRFARYLPEFGWEPVVLTVHKRAYDQVREDQLRDIPTGIEVIRAPAWDAARHFSLFGRYPGWLARPDRWVSWWLGATAVGYPAIRRLQPAAIWSTYPVATAHKIGTTLARRTGLPFIADFRDPMVQPGYPADPHTRRSFHHTESGAISVARMCTFTTPSAARTYRERYPDHADRIRVLENGYDEETFVGIPIGEALNPGKLTVLHSGIVYPSERDPTQLFAALAALKSHAPAAYAQLRIRFRAAAHEGLLRQLAEKFAVAAAIEIVPLIAYRDALAEMLAADGLLLLQAANCNEQIPAKFYEYLRAGKPILVLADPAGDTAEAARKAGLQSIAGLDDPKGIERVFQKFLADPKQGTLPTAETVRNSSRRGRTAQFAGLLDSITY